MYTFLKDWELAVGSLPGAPLDVQRLDQLVGLSRNTQNMFGSYFYLK